MICLVFGAQGSGKTLFLAKTGYEYYKKGYTVYSNFKLNFPYKELDFEQMLACEYNNAIILIDEAHLWGLDARDGMSKQNKELTKKFIVQVRKQGVKLYCASQRFRQLDVRLRENSEIVIRCKKYAMIDKKIKEVFQSETFEINTPIIIELEYTHLDIERTVYKRFIANDYYSTYDTTQVIKMISETKKGESIGKKQNTKKTNKTKTKKKKSKNSNKKSSKKKK